MAAQVGAALGEHHSQVALGVLVERHQDRGCDLVVGGGLCVGVEIQQNFG